MNIRDFLKVYNDVKTYPLNVDVASVFGIHERTVRKWAQKARDKGFFVTDRGMSASADDDPAVQVAMDLPDPDSEIVEENVRYQKQLQRQRDKNRVQNKSFREHSRVENAVSEYNRELIDILRRKSPTDKIKVHPSSGNGNPVGVVHITDVHFNELVDLPNNQYNWNMASARIREHINTAIRYFKPLGVTDVLVALTGDLLNSDRRLDELLMNAQNRAKATFLAFDILRQGLLHLNEHFNVSCAGISGNESRIPKDVGWAQPVASDNYDFTIFNMLAVNLNSEGINFNTADDPSEVVVNVNGNNFLLLHGHGAIKGDITGSVAKLKARYLDMGVEIRYAIFGHIHQAYVSDFFSRGGSTVGANDFSAKALNLTGRASQNLHIAFDDGRIDSIKVDLQTVNEDDGYNIDSSLEAYNSKSHSKLHEGKVIFEVVV